MPIIEPVPVTPKKPNKCVKDANNRLDPASRSRDPHELFGLALRYIEQNPVRARLCNHPEDWPWSSARTHLNLPPATGIGDPLTDTAATQGLIDDWQSYLDDSIPESAADALRQHTRTGRPFATNSFTAKLEQTLSRPLAPAKRGRPKKQTTHKPKG